MPNNKKQMKAQRRVTKQEQQRRQEQSKRDKKAAAPPQVRPSPMSRPVVRSSRPRPSGMVQSDNALALAMSAPQVTQPQRLPTLSRRKTDVRALWLTGTLSTGRVPDSYGNNVYTSSTIGPVPDVAATTDVGLSLGTIDRETNLVYITRDPLCPLFINVTSLLIHPGTPTPTTSGHFTGYDWKLRWPGDSFRVLAQAGASVKTQSAFESSPLRIAAPASLAANQSASGTFAFPLSPMTTTQAISTFLRLPAPQTDPLVALQHGPSVVPAGYSAQGRSTYAWHTGGFLAIQTLLRRPTSAWPDYVLPAGLDAGISFVIFRYIGGDDMEEQTADGMIYCPIAAGSSSGTVKSLDLAAGYYRVEARSWLIANSTGAIISSIGDFYAQFNIQSINVYWPFVAGFAASISANHLFPVTNMDVYNSGKFMLERCRVTSAAVTLTNTSAALAKSGTLQGARLYGTGFFTDVPLEKIGQIAGNPTFGYYGPLEKGGYTFLPPPQDPETFYDSILDTANGSLSADYPVASLDQMEDAHVFWARTNSGDGSFSTSYLPSYSYRCDYHIEFISESQLATCRITAMPSQVFTEATIILTSGRYFYENPSHLKQLWGWIKSAGSLALRAAGSAAARSLLESATMAIVAF